MVIIKMKSKSCRVCLYDKYSNIYHRCQEYVMLNYIQLKV